MCVCLGVVSLTTLQVSLLVGERTGWFYDQRDNRALLVPLCKDKTVLGERVK